MSADALLQDLTQAIYIALFVMVVWQAVQHRSRVNTDVALFFGAIATVVLTSRLSDVLPGRGPDIASDVSGSLFAALPYILLRLVDDFAGVRSWILRLAEAGLAISIMLFIVLPAPLPPAALLWLVLYVVAVAGKDTYRFIREARTASGVTKRRMQAVAGGSLLIGLVTLVAGLQLLFPGYGDVWRLLLRLLALSSGVAYFIGFAPPAWLRRAWQEPELRAFLGRAASLPRLPDTASITAELERGAAAALGVPRAAVDLWDSETGRLKHSWTVDGRGTAPGEFIAARVLESQEARLSIDVANDDLDHAGVYRAAGVRAVLAAPITAGARRLGVLCAFAPHAPMFASEDLVLVRLLADQAAVILESRALIDEAARVRAREEATRLKDDFLSAAAHDLKTPLTTLVAQAQLLERRARRSPDAPADLSGIERIVREAIRLRNLVLELLDASRAEQGNLLTHREPVDLTALAREACRRHESARACVLEAAQPVVGDYDRTRMMQLLDNLVENAIKYSPAPEPVMVRVYAEDGEARLEVQDHGIGIPAADVERVFDRFFRAGNVDDRRFAGMGLGLYICHGIVKQHGGRIWVESHTAADHGRQQGTTFHVALPLAVPGTNGRVAAVPAAGAAGAAGAER